MHAYRLSKIAYECIVWMWAPLRSRPMPILTHFSLCCVYIWNTYKYRVLVVSSYTSAEHEECPFLADTEWNYSKNWVHIPLFGSGIIVTCIMFWEYACIREQEHLLLSKEYRSSRNRTWVDALYNMLRKVESIKLCCIVWDSNRWK